MDERKGLKSLVDRYFERRARTRGDVWWLKVHGGPYQRAGVPDYLFCIGGRFGALEIKHPGEKNPKPDPRQQVELDHIAGAGGWTLVSNDIAEITAELGAF